MTMTTRHFVEFVCDADKCNKTAQTDVDMGSGSTGAIPEGWYGGSVTTTTRDKRVRWHACSETHIKQAILTVLAI